MQQLSLPSLPKVKPLRHFLGKRGVANRIPVTDRHPTLSLAIQHACRCGTSTCTRRSFSSLRTCSPPNVRRERRLVQAFVAWTADAQRLRADLRGIEGEE